MNKMLTKAQTRVWIRHFGADKCLVQKWHQSKPYQYLLGPNNETIGRVTKNIFKWYPEMERIEHRNDAINCSHYKF